MYSGIYLSSDPGISEERLQIFRVGKLKFRKRTVHRANVTLTDDPITEGLFEVPLRGVYRPSCQMTIDGKSAGRWDKPTILGATA